MANQNHVPPEVDAQLMYDELWEELLGIFARHQLLQQLFSKPETLDVINRSAGGLFLWVQRDFVDAIFASAMRLLDHDNNRQNNLSFRRLVEDAQLNFPLPEAEAFMQQVEQIYLETAKIRDHRNKRMSHRDLDIAMGRAAQLPDVTWKELDDLVERLHRAFDQWSLLRRSTTHSREVGIYGDGDQLVRDLRLGQEAGERMTEEALAAVRRKP